MLAVHEIFTTIQGEGYDTGIPCTFIRLFGCNVHCTYCDQPQDKEDMQHMSIDEIVLRVEMFKTKNICITGGEPLAQRKVYTLINELNAKGYNVSIETNGTIDIQCCEERPHKFVMDVKCPSSGVFAENKTDNLKRLSEKDEVKFVIADRLDYNYMKHVLQLFPTKAKILLSPMFDPNQKQTIGKDLCDWVIEDNLDVKIQIQLHKILGVL